MPTDDLPGSISVRYEDDTAVIVAEGLKLFNGAAYLRQMAQLLAKENKKIKNVILDLRGASRVDAICFGGIVESVALAGGRVSVILALPDEGAWNARVTRALKGAGIVRICKILPT